jgi:GNAT superfamily N-acetyltransferase
MSDYYLSRSQLTEEMWQTLQPLLRKHYKELAHYEDIPLQPDKDFYFALQYSGALRIYAAVSMATKEIVGYAVMIVRSAPHYSGSLQAVQDVLWVDFAHRHNGLGTALVEFVDNELRKEGVQVVYQHVKLAHRALQHVLETAGYVPVDLIMGKRLDKEA